MNDSDIENMIYCIADELGMDCNNIDETTEEYGIIKNLVQVIKERHLNKYIILDQRQCDMGWVDYYDK